MIELSEIKEAVCEVFGFKNKELESKARPERLAWARMTYMEIAANQGHDIYSISDSVNRDRTSVNHASKTIPDLVETHAGVRLLYWKVQDALGLERTQLEKPQANHISA